MKRCVSCKHVAWRAHYCPECGGALKDDARLTRRVNVALIITFLVLVIGVALGWGLAAAGAFRAGTTLSFAVDTNAPNCTGTYSYHIDLTDTAGKGVAGQPIIVSLDGTRVETLRTDQNGRLESLKEVSSDWCGARHTFLASYPGSFRYAGSENTTVFTTRVPTIIILDTPAQVLAGIDAPLRVTVRDGRTNLPIANKMVRVWNDRDAIYASTDANGTASIVYRSPVPGAESLTATFLADDEYNTSSTSLAFTVGEPSMEAIVARTRPSVVAISHNTTIGSGVIIRTDQNVTTILTNRHVIAGVNTASELMITFSDGKKAFATNVRVAPYLIDLAVVTLAGVYGRPAIVPLDAEYAQGVSVFAIGAPRGIQGSVSQGILSNRLIVASPDNYTFAVLQTDAAINPGNSGGGLFSRASGSLLGINTEKILDAEGLGFAIDAREFLKLPPDPTWPSLT